MDLIRKYFPELSVGQLERLSRLGELYTEWNNKINLISRKDMDHLYERHIMHSLSIFRFYKFSPGTEIMDAGTGGGLPGLPLAIANPGANFTLVDSIAKKIMVVKDIIAKLELKNAIAVNQRAEQIKGNFHFVTSRAVTNFPAFYSLVNRKISKQNLTGLQNGILYLKGGDFDEEITAFQKNIRIVNLSSYFEEEFYTTKKLIYLPV